MSNRLTVTRATQGMIDNFRGRLREADAKECFQMTGLSVEEGLQRSFEVSTKSWVALWDERPTVVFGAAPAGHFDTDRGGVLWMLATEDIDTMPISFVRGSVEYLGYMFEEFDLLWNFVADANTVSVRWLKWLGFNVEDPLPMANGALFRYFWMRREEFLCAHP